MIINDKKLIEFPIAYICNCCGKTISKAEDELAFDEVWSIRKVGGYASVLGDGNVVGLDLCENCVEKILGPYLQNLGNIIHDD